MLAFLSNALPDFFVYECMLEDTYELSALLFQGLIPPHYLTIFSLPLTARAFCPFSFLFSLHFKKHHVESHLAFSILNCTFIAAEIFSLHIISIFVFLKIHFLLCFPHFRVNNNVQCLGDELFRYIFWILLMCLKMKVLNITKIVTDIKYNEAFYMLLL